MADRASTFRWTEEIKRETTQEITACLTKWFSNYGWPRVIRCDNAPSFREQFQTWCQEHEILVEHSSPHNSPSNGFIEANLKKTKMMVKKTGAIGKKLSVLMQISNLGTNSDGTTASDLFWKRKIRVPGLPTTKTTVDLEKQKEIRDKTHLGIKEKVGKRFSAKEFRAGDKVRIQNPVTKQWKEKGTVVSERIADDGSTTSYHIQLKGDQGMLLRNGKFLRARRSWLKRLSEKRVTFSLLCCSAK